MMRQKKYQDHKVVEIKNIMPKTKITPRKPGFLCSICFVHLPSKDEWSDHLLAYGMADINKRKFECDVCDQTFSKKIVLVRHMKRIHSIREVPRC